VDLILSALMLVAVALIAGAFFLWRRDGMKKQVWLMLLLAMVMVGNVLIWTVPDKNGTAPLDRAAEGLR
jgi:hypothetical protein